MNPAELFRLKAEMNTFQQEHPKFTSFLQYSAEHCIKNGNVVEMTIRQAEGKEIRSNLRLSDRDVETLLHLYNLLKND